PAQPMHERYYPYSVILPDRRVLVVGGRMGRGDHMHPPMPASAPGETTDGPPQDPQAIREPELYDPDVGTWQVMAPMSRDRLYHSNASLLPDGRVMVAGSNPARGSNELTIEIFHPPYLFGGERPAIEGAPATIDYGETFEIATPQ